LRRGAARVLGVDLSEDMLRIAREEEAARPVGAEYQAQDAAALALGETFDRALAVYLLHYAGTREALAGMCRSIAQHVAPGGRFLTFVINPDLPSDPAYYVPFGVRIDIAPPPYGDGQALQFGMWLGDAWTPWITVYRWSLETLRASLLEAGFSDVRVVPLSVAKDAELGEAHFRPYVERPHCILVEAKKAQDPSGASA
jgi:SAM-dependent methyltransferase